MEKHNIQYEMESIIDRTLMLQRPNMERPGMKRFENAQVQVDFEQTTEDSRSPSPFEDKLSCSLKVTLEKIPDDIEETIEKEPIVVKEDIKNNTDHVLHKISKRDIFTMIR